MTFDKIVDSLPPSGSEISIKALINFVKEDAVKYNPISVT